MRIMRKKTLRTLALGLMFATLFSTAAFAKGWEKVGSDWFYFVDDNTVGKNAWVVTLAEDGVTVTSSYWVKEDGTMAKDSWVYDGEAWYRVDGQGAPLKNQFYRDSSDFYWLGADGRMLANGWHQSDDGRWYYFQENGKAFKNGWKTIDGDEYYFLKTGTMAMDVNIPGGGHVGADGRRDR